MKTSIREIYDKKLEFTRSDNKQALADMISSNTIISTTEMNELNNTIYLESNESTVMDMKECIDSSISKWYENRLSFDPFLLYNILKLSNNSCMIKI
jgi:hypothetical protein